MLSHQMPWQNLIYLSTTAAISFGVQALAEQACCCGHSMLVSRADTLLTTWPWRQPWQYRCFPQGQQVACVPASLQLVLPQSIAPPHANLSQQVVHFTFLSADANIWELGMSCAMSMMALVVPVCYIRCGKFIAAHGPPAGGSMPTTRHCLDCKAVASVQMGTSSVPLTRQTCSERHASLAWVYLGQVTIFFQCVNKCTDCFCCQAIYVFFKSLSNISWGLLQAWLVWRNTRSAAHCCNWAIGASATTTGNFHASCHATNV